MNNEEKILALLGQMQGQLNRLEEGQSVIEYEISEMKTRQNKTTSTLVDIQRDQTILKQGQSKLALNIRDIKEDTAITRDVVNGVSEWTEIASDVLKITYPLKKAE